MNKIFLTQLGLGILIGTSIFASVSYINNLSEGVFFDNSNGAMHRFDYSDVFSSKIPTNLFSMVYYKQNGKPESDAVEYIARKYALTKIEAKDAINGSLSVILRNQKKNTVQMTRDQAMRMISSIRNDYEKYKETIEMQQEIDMAVTATELFSNGILTDSSFDLIHDLDIIEEILFEEVEDTRLSGEHFTQDKVLNYLKDSFDNLIDDTDTDTDNDHKESNNDKNINNNEDTDTNNNYDVNTDSNDDNYNELADIAETNNDTPTYGDVIIADTDACSSNGNSENGSNSNTNGDFNNQSDIFDYYDHSTNNGGNNNDYSGAQENDNTDPHKYDYTPYTPPVKKDNTVCFGGATENDPDDHTSFSAEVCVTYTEIMGHYGTITPGRTCVDCELEKTNDYFSKTLSHSLMPNKLTGNLGENTKCKAPYKASAPLDLKFIAIPVPIPTTPNIDIVVDGDPIAEWNKLMNSNGYKIATIPEFGSTDKTEIADEAEVAKKIVMTKDKDRTFDSLNEKITKEDARRKHEQELKTLAAQRAKDIENVSIFTREIYEQVDQFYMYLNNELDLMRKINREICPSILSKKSI